MIAESKRDQRVIAWLVEQAGDSTMLAVCRQLSGARRAYPCNVAKALGLTPPVHVTLAAPADAEQHLAAIRKALGMR